MWASGEGVVVVILEATKGNALREGPGSRLVWIRKIWVKKESRHVVVG